MIGVPDGEQHDIALAAIKFQLVIIGEAVSGLDESLRQRCPEIAWNRVVGLRNELVHGYHRIDDDAIRLLIGDPLRVLRAACISLLDDL